MSLWLCFWGIILVTVHISSLIDLFFHQPQRSPPWSCARTTLVWPLTSVLWGLSPPTTSPSSSGPLSQILLWVSCFCLRLFTPFSWFYTWFLTDQSFPLSGAWLLWHVHSETAPVHVCSRPGVHHPPYLQSQRASHLRHGHPVSAGDLSMSKPTLFRWKQEHLLILLG